MKGKSVLTSQQIAHVLALHLAGRSLFIEELALLTGNVLPASDERWRELERLGLAERVSSPHGNRVEGRAMKPLHSDAPASFAEGVFSARRKGVRPYLSP